MTKPSLLMAVTGLLASVVALQDQPANMQVPHNSVVSCLTWDNDGSRVAAGTMDGTISITDAITGKQIRSLQSTADSLPDKLPRKNAKPLGPGEPILCMAFQGDGKRLVFVHLRSTDLWDFQSGNQEWVLNNRLDCPSFECIAFTPYRDEIVAMGVAWFSQRRLDRRSVGGSLDPNPGGGGCASVAPDGSATGWCDTKGQLFWRTPRNLLQGGGIPPARKLQIGTARCIAFAPGGKLLAAGGINNIVQIWDLEANKVIRVLTGLEKPATQLSMAANGRRLTAIDGNGTSICVWDIDRQALRWRLEHGPDPVGTIALSPDGMMLATTAKNGKSLLLWMAMPRPIAYKGPPTELSAKELASLWSDLGGIDHKSADDAYQKLGAAGDHAIQFLSERFRAFAGTAVDRERIDEFVRELDSAKFATREQAFQGLLAAGQWAIVPLRVLLDGDPSPEARKRADQLLQQILKAAPKDSRLAIFDAIELLESERSGLAAELLDEIVRESVIPEIRLAARQAWQRLKN